MMENESNTQMYETNKIVIVHHYILTGIFFIFAVVTTGLYGILVKQVTHSSLLHYIFYFSFFGFVFIFTKKLYFKFNVLFKYIFIAIVLLFSCFPIFIWLSRT